MGPARQPSVLPDVLSKQQQNVFQSLCSLPSPASTTGSLDSPTPKFAFSRSQSYTSRHTSRDDLSETANLLPTEPGVVKLEPVMTPPLLSDKDEPNMNIIVGGALAPVRSSPPPRPPPRTGPGLRLPSFQALGIAAPHPDRFGVVSINDTAPGAARESTQQESARTPYPAFDILQAFESIRIGTPLVEVTDPSPLKSGRAVQSPVHHYVHTLTPPSDGGGIEWNFPPTVQTAAMDSPATDPGNIVIRGGHSPVASGSGGAGSSSQAGRNRTPFDEPALWLTGAIGVLLQTLRTSPFPNDSLRILSHALPSPSESGHVFSQVIVAINGSTPASPSSPMTWINVFHAVPGRFNLADIPTSPPNTPGPPIGGDDYFTQKVFDSAVSISDYQEDMSSFPRSPLPVVPPSSINVSIVERYIPPSSPNEFTNMFNPNGPSILVDRLVELSPNNGTLLFIYPTRTGAQTFMTDYLGPILDPLLRTMCVVHGLSSELSRTLGSMSAIDQLPEYDTMQRRVTNLCARLSQRNSAAQRFHGRRPDFSVSYASKEYVRLDREVWARDWWIKQEKVRIRDTITQHTREAQKKSSNEHVERAATPTELVQQLLDGLTRKAYQAGQEPGNGIEVCVFVIKRSE